MDLPILYEDEVLLVINKPPGVVVNRAESVKSETVQEWAEKKLSAVSCQLSAQNSDFCNRAGIVHRIDKETSGILLIAKTPEAFVELQRLFKERLVKKTYLAIVHGRVLPNEGEIRAPVGRLPWNPEKFGIVPGGKEAVTRYKAVSCQPCLAGRQVSAVSQEYLTLIELYPETGRTHQIRVHLKYINHPIVGDYLYAGRVVSRNDRIWATRVMLHAWKISFTHPATGKILAIESPIPDDMNIIIKN